MELLTQKKGKERRSFKLKDNGLAVTVQNEFGTVERLVLYENISNNLIKYNWGLINWLVLVLIIFLIVISGFFLKLFGVEGEGKMYYYVIIACLGGLFSLYNLTKEEFQLICYDKFHIDFFKNIPSEQELNKFIETLKKKRNQTLKEKYGFVSANLPFDEQLEKLVLLHNLEAITLEEFTVQREELESIFENNKFGFSSN